MTLLKMIVLFPVLTLMAFWQGLIMFLMTYKLAWDMIKKFNKERYL